MISALDCVAQDIILTNGPADPDQQLYIGGGRTNVLICQKQIESDANIVGSSGWGAFDIHLEIRNPGGDHSISNLRCTDASGNVIGYPKLLGGYGSTDGKTEETWYRIDPTIEREGFDTTVGIPTIVNIVADIGSGFSTGDQVNAFWDGIYDLDIDGDFYSTPVSTVTSFTVLTDAALIGSITKTGQTIELHSQGKPNAGYDVEAADSPAGPWQTITTAHVESSDSGDIVFDYQVATNKSAEFFRLVLN